MSDLSKMEKTENKLQKERLAIVSSFENCDISAKEAIDLLLALSRRIESVIKEGEYPSSDEYYKVIFDDALSLFNGNESIDTIEIETGYLMRRRLELLDETLSIDILQIQIEAKVNYDGATN